MNNEQSMFGFFRAAELPIKLRLVVFFVLSLTALCFAVASIAFILRSDIFFAKKVETKSEEHVMEKIGIVRAEQEYSLTYEVKDMSIGFINRSGTRTAYAQFTLLFDCETELCVKNLTLNRAKLLDAIYQVSGIYYIEDFTAPLMPEGMKRFKLAILQFIKTNIPGEPPRNVVFREWFMN